MNGSVLVKTVSDHADDDVRNRLKDGHSRYYEESSNRYPRNRSRRDVDDPSR